MVVIDTAHNCISIDWSKEEKTFRTVLYTYDGEEERGVLEFCDWCIKALFPAFRLTRILSCAISL